MMCKKPYVKNPSRLPRAAELLKNGTEKQKLSVTPLPCGQCLHCRINKRREWVLRLMFELMVSKRSVFVTLTYNNEAIPEGNSLRKSDVQNFIKKLRRKLKDRNIRYLAVGEYGNTGTRGINPHYHLAVFDVEYGRDEAAIQSCWPDDEKGFSYTGELNRETAQYICGYTVEKLTRGSERQVEQLKKGLSPEFMNCSKGSTAPGKWSSGIGSQAMWLIAQNIKRDGRITNRTFKKIQKGTKRLPLGRYLISKLSEYSEIPEKVIKNDLELYQADIADEMECTEKGWYDAIISKEAVRRHQQEKRYRMYRKRKKL